VNWGPFLLASTVLAVTPGPGVLYIVTRTLAQGRRVGLASVAGVALGNFGSALAASLGVAAVLALSTLAFNVLKWAGAAYLVWLGLKALRAAPAGAAAPAAAAPDGWRVLRDGFWVALLNPKTALFFAAFLPQFIDAQGPAAAQGLLLGTCFVAIAALTDSLWVLAAAQAAPRLAGLRGTPAAGRYATAAVFIGLGLLTAFSGSRARGP
jgi:threonine/homoserine/homoserine lactone efflux protein